MKFRKNLLFFCLGGWIYVGLELLYRRRSHASMFVAGGICFFFLGRLENSRLPGWSKPILGAGVITSVELLTGLAVNRHHTVWDYRDQPGNFRGQICPVFALAWVPLAWAAMGIYRQLEEKWQAMTSPD